MLDNRTAVRYGYTRRSDEQLDEGQTMKPLDEILADPEGYDFLWDRAEMMLEDEPDEYGHLSDEELLKAAYAELKVDGEAVAERDAEYS